ncbi:MAG TPA: hemerythrin domain-containing protein [Roseimicrobium sp.]|nr:hemerythrin domain-containing protein [Roseimicrobium sp.]
MKITEALLAEHVVFHHLFDQLEQTAKGVKSVVGLQTLATVLGGMLHQHSLVEDQLLMEPLDHCLDHLGQKETFHDEHEMIDKSMALIMSAKTVPKARRQLLETIQRAREHFDKEERIVFPLAEDSLSDRTLKSLGQDWRERRKIGIGKHRH